MNQAIRFPSNAQYYVTRVMTATKFTGPLPAGELHRIIESDAGYAIDAPSLIMTGSVAKATNRVASGAPNSKLRDGD